MRPFGGVVRARPNGDRLQLVSDRAVGREAQVDFADVRVILAGVITKLNLFTFCLSYSGSIGLRMPGDASQGNADSFQPVHRNMPP